MSTILAPLPDHDFDLTEIAVPWKLLTRAGHRVVFATERGATPATDPLLISGVLFGKLGAEPEPIAFYREMEQDPSFAAPRAWTELDPAEFDALHLTGGHAPGMKQYLEAEPVRAIARHFFEKRKPVSAICHGVIVLARAGVLPGRRTTCLPKYMERTAYFTTAWKLGRYYRTYDAYVEDEVVQSMNGPGFERGPVALFTRGTDQDDSAAFVVEDDHYVSARWPGDAYLIAKKLMERLPAPGK